MPFMSHITDIMLYRTNMKYICKLWGGAIMAFVMDEKQNQKKLSNELEKIENYLSEIVKNSSDKIQKYSLEEYSGHIRLLLKIYELQLSKYRVIQADQRMLNNLTISIFSLFSGGAIGTIVTLLINLNQK